MMTAAPPGLLESVWLCQQWSRIGSWHHQALDKGCVWEIVALELRPEHSVRNTERQRRAGWVAGGAAAMLWLLLLQSTGRSLCMAWSLGLRGAVRGCEGLCWHVLSSGSRGQCAAELWSSRAALRTVHVDLPHSCCYFFWPND